MATLTPEQRAKSISRGKKKKYEKPARMAIACPFPEYWPLVKENCAKELAELMSKLIVKENARAKVSRKLFQSIPKLERKERIKEMRSISSEAKQLRRKIILGYNGTLKSIRNGTCCAVVCEGSNGNMRRAIQLLVLQAAVSRVPVIAVDAFADLTNNVFGFSSSALSLRVSEQYPGEHFNPLFQLIRFLSSKFPIPKNMEYLRKNEKICEESANETTVQCDRPVTEPSGGLVLEFRTGKEHCPTDTLKDDQMSMVESRQSSCTEAKRNSLKAQSETEKVEMDYSKDPSRNEEAESRYPTGTEVKQNSLKAQSETEKVEMDYSKDPSRNEEAESRYPTGTEVKRNSLKAQSETEKVEMDYSKDPSRNEEVERRPSKVLNETTKVAKINKILSKIKDLIGNKDDFYLYKNNSSEKVFVPYRNVVVNSDKRSSIKKEDENFLSFGFGCAATNNTRNNANNGRFNASVRGPQKRSSSNVLFHSLHLKYVKKNPDRLSGKRK